MPIGKRGSQNEAACFDAAHGIDAAPINGREQRTELRYRLLEMVAQQWRDVPKQDAGLRKIRDVADVLAQGAHDCSVR
jgi:hypothetical protein